MNAQHLTELLADATRKWRALGPTTISRFHDWTPGPTQPASTERGGGTTPNDQTIRDHQDNHRAARYHTELTALTTRLHHDLTRLTRLIEIAHPDQPRVLRHTDLTASQLIMDGWCPSCFRDQGHLAPIAEGRYRDRCRTCGETRARNGTDPTLEELRLVHARGKRLRQRTA